MLRQEVLRRSSASLFSLQSSARRCLLVLSLLAGIWAVEGSVGSAQDPDDLVWQQTKGPVGGSVRDLAVDPTTGSLFALTDRGFFRSTTDSGSWEETLNFALRSTVVVNPRTGAVFVGTLVRGLHRSVDGGATWALIDSIASNGGPPSLALDPQGRLYIAFTSREGQTRVSHLRRSADDGETWETLSFPDSLLVASLLIHPDTGTLLAAAWYGHIYRSTDDGATWTRVTFVGSGRIGERRLAVDPHTGQLFLIVKGWLFHSVNDGQTWGRFAFSPGNVAAFTIDENGDFFVGTSGDGVFRSTDGGQTWEAASTGLPPYPFDISEPYYKSHLGVRTLAVTPEGHLLTGMRDGGVYRSTNKGATWTAINAGLIATNVHALAVTPEGHLVAGLRGGRLARSTDGGETWLLIEVPILVVDHLVSDADGRLFATRLLEGGPPLLRSMDGGQTWEGLDLPGFPRDEYKPIVVTAEGHLYVGNLTGLYRSTDLGRTWTLRLGDPGQQLWIRTLATGPTGDLYAANFRWVFHSNDQGATWTQHAFPEENGFVHTLVVNAEGHLFVGASWGIFRSTDKGASWTAVYRPGTRNGTFYVTALLVSPQGHLFAGTICKGALRSTDGGDTWHPINTGIPAAAIHSLALDPATGVLFAGTEAHGVFRADLHRVEGVERRYASVPTQSQLLQNFPNPFQAATIIEFALAEASHVRLAVFDGLGRKIAALVDEPMQPGVYRLPFAADSLPSGLYVYRLETQARTVTQTMIHVR